MEKRLVLTTVSEGDLQRPDFFRMLGCKVHLGRPKKTATTFTHIVIYDLPKERTSFEVLNCLQEIGIGIISPQAIPGALTLSSLAQGMSSQALLITSEDKWEELLSLKPALILFKLKDRHEADSFFNWCQDKEVGVPIIFHYSHEMELDFKGGAGIWIDAPLSLELRREMSFNLVKYTEMGRQL